MRIGTLALVVRFDGESPVLIETLSDDDEIRVLESAVLNGEKDPLERVHELRRLQREEDEKFGDYVEYLLSQPCLKAEVRHHGLEWFYSKMRIEKYRRTEAEAAQVIATYALQVYLDSPDRSEFVLAGPRAKVQVRVFALQEAQRREAA